MVSTPYLTASAFCMTKLARGRANFSGPGECGSSRIFRITNSGPHGTAFAYELQFRWKQPRKAAYAQGPKRSLPVSANSTGAGAGLTFASPQNNAIYENTSSLGSPRIVFAWTPSAFPHKTRGIPSGFDFFVQPVSIATLQVRVALLNSTNPLSLQAAFSPIEPRWSPRITATLRRAATLSESPNPGGKHLAPPVLRAGWSTFRRTGPSLS